MTDLPWMVEAKRLLGRHETRDKSWLMRCFILIGAG